MAEQLKELFSKEFISLISKEIKKHYSSFDSKMFEKEVLNKNWNSLELKERMRHISSTINDFLPFTYKEQIKILINTKQTISHDYSMALQFMVFQDFVEVFGLDDFDTSLDALEVFTIESSSEFAIRHFIIKYEEQSMQKLKQWTKSENEHLRRLASEGCRPRLPWAIALPKFKKDASKVLEILELLKNDESLYVRKSVANNLNDISKDNPELVIEFVKKNISKSKNLDWLCKHASRTLLKKGDRKILELFGYKSDKDFKIENLNLDRSVKIGELLNFSFDLKTSKKQLGNIRLEYAIYYQKANATLSKKVYMLSQNKIEGSEKSFKKSQSFKLITTRKFHKGLHKLAIIVNGEEKALEEFILEA